MSFLELRNISRNTNNPPQVGARLTVQDFQHAMYGARKSCMCIANLFTVYS